MKQIYNEGKQDCGDRLRDVSHSFQVPYSLPLKRPPLVKNCLGMFHSVHLPSYLINLFSLSISHTLQDLNRFLQLSKIFVNINGCEHRMNITGRKGTRRPETWSFAS